MTSDELEQRAKNMGITVTVLGLVRTADAARILSMSPRTLEEWRQSGIGPPFIKKQSRIVWYRLTDLAAWYDG